MNPSAPRPPGAADIAIIGMAGRFPGADDVEGFWENLLAGRESIRRFGPEELAATGFPAELLSNPSFVPARGVVKDVECFDAAFFSCAPREAELIDPQHRLFLECAWAAIEDAGYDPRACGRGVGVFAGANHNTYLLLHLLAGGDAIAKAHELVLHSDKDFLATRASYKLNLRGPSVAVQCACSTSLVCVHLACQALVAGECDMALAGGVSVVFPQVGYFHEEGGVLSPDGHCRAFDRRAAGTVTGDGVAAVLLKRREDAERDGDHIYALILGTAVNNDGGGKASYAAPSLDGQAQVIAEALGAAGVEPSSIGYVEAHGTGTPLGDPIEVASLNRAFADGTLRPRTCALGTVKPNIGHLNQAAGVTSLIKAALAVQRGMLPPTLHFEEANPQIDFAGGPFYVNSACAPWPAAGGPRRAGVSSFGFGGTNAHVVLEQAAPPEPAACGRRWEILPLSARTEQALDATAERLGRHLERHPDLPLADVAHVLQGGRTEFSHRRFVVADSSAGARALLAERSPGDGRSGRAASLPPSAHFLFPGQGAQYAGMGRELYRAEAPFRNEIDRAAELLQPLLGFDLRELILAPIDRPPEDDPRLGETRIAQPALYAVSYALARLWMERGVQPAGLIGHSIGEWVAAAVAGVFRPDDALRLVALRGVLLQELPPGGMLAAGCSAARAQELTAGALDLAAVNAPEQCVLSGGLAEIAAAEEGLRRAGVSCQRLRVARAFHSAMTEPAMAKFAAAVGRTERAAPTIPLISNLTGRWIEPAEAMDPAYWAAHLRHPVRFADGLETLLASGPAVLIEAGPGRTLAGLARRHPRFGPEHEVLGCLESGAGSDAERFLKAQGTLWLRGAPPDWGRSRDGERRRRVPLPAYPFERSRHFVAAAPPGPAAAVPDARLAPERWIYLPGWSRVPATVAGEEGVLPRECLILCSDPELRRDLEREAMGCNLRLSWAGEGERPGTDDAGRLEALLAGLIAEGRRPRLILDARDLDARGVAGDSPDGAEPPAGRGLLALAQALARADCAAEPLDLVVASAGMQDVGGNEPLRRAAGSLLGLCRILPREQARVRCRSVDFAWDAPRRRIARQLAAELTGGGPAGAIAYRGEARFEECYRRWTPAAGSPPACVQPGETVLITGGLGEVGLSLAEYLFRKRGARLALLGRSGAPPAPGRPAENGPGPAAARRLQALVASGAEILILRADVADEPAMRAAVAEVRARFGGLHGVVHAAGLSGPEVFRGLLETRWEDFERHGRCKVDGVRVLEAVLEGIPDLRFCVLQSSLLGVLGGAGCGAYAAASVHMDRAAVARTRRPGGPAWISVNWDAWRPADAPLDARSRLAIGAEEAGACLERVLALRGLGQVLVSTCDLEERLRRSGPRAEAEAAPNAAGARPATGAAFRAPQSELERSLASIWEKLLGTAPVGADDDFFELGGHSLLAAQIIAQVKEIFPAEFEFHDVVDNPTLGRMAAMLESRLIEKLESLSEEEAAAAAGTGDRP